MIVDVPYQFEINVRYPKKRLWTTALVADRFPVEIREVEDAVLVARVPDDRDDGPVVEYWHWDGSFWATLLPGYGAKEPISLDDYVDALKAGTSTGRAIFADRSYNRTQPRDSIEAIGAQEIGDSKQEEVTAGMIEASMDVISVGGTMLRRSNEPVINASYERFTKGEGGFVYLRYAELESTNGRSTSSMWRLDHFDRLHRVLLNGRAPEAEEMRHRPPAVLRPDLLSWDRELHAFWSQIDGDLASYVREGFEDTSVEEFSAYAKLRDLVRSLDRTTHASLDRARMALEALDSRISPEITWPRFSRTKEILQDLDDLRAETNQDDAALASLRL